MLELCNECAIIATKLSNHFQEKLPRQEVYANGKHLLAISHQLALHFSAFVVQEYADDFIDTSFPMRKLDDATLGHLGKCI